MKKKPIDARSLTVINDSHTHYLYINEMRQCVYIQAAKNIANNFHFVCLNDRIFVLFTVTKKSSLSSKLGHLISTSFILTGEDRGGTTDTAVYTVCAL